ncbi:MAG: type II toxin-antitoxin system VapC family toxin [Spirochaetales bacterium]|nr:type II toxin-antitoxin system VapC family toxin [Spirochaetales bacterium]
MIEFLVDGPRAGDVEQYIGDGEAAISAISVYELLAGVRSPLHAAQRSELIALLRVVPVDIEVAERAAALYTTLRNTGITIENEDVVIAATALHFSMPILTINTRHFRHVSSLNFA